MSKFLALSLLLLPLSLHAASRQGDYEAARKIALRDPKVRAAYAAADRKLAERIVQIDPTLKGYPSSQPAPKAKQPTAKAKTSAAKAKQPAAKPAPKPTPAPKIRGAKHKVAAGETLESIAVRYRVGVPTLKQANPGVQERRLQVGQVLIVPKKNTAPTPGQ